MPLRAFKLPADIPVLVDLIPSCFVYPENEEWNIQQDEVVSMVDSLNGVRRIWPLIRLVMLISPPVRDSMRGFVWEEDGRVIGLTNVVRMGTTDQWLIGNVGVLPEYRRRGIARQLVELSVTYARERGAKSVVLDVIDGNVPAYNLYQKLGFEHYSGQTQLRYDGDDGQTGDGVPALPDGYTLQPSSPFDWRPRYALAKRSVPEVDQRYSPVEEGRFREPRVLRPLIPIINRMSGGRGMWYEARHTATGQAVAFARGRYRTRAGGINLIDIQLDPAHAALAPDLVALLLSTLGQRSPGRRIECHLPQWQTPVIDALLAAGFTRVADMCTMGIIIE